MAKERKTRQARKKIDTSSLKEFGAGEDFKSRGQQKLAFAKTVKEEADSVQSQIAKEQSKAQEKSLWSSIGGALGGLALGLATGGAGFVAAGIGAGLGTYGGAQAGKALSESKSGKRKKIKSDMFYENEADKQNLAFSEFDDKLNDSILTRSLAAGVMAAAFTGGGDLIKKMKEGKSAREAAKAAKILKETAGSSMNPIALTASGEPAYSGATGIVENIGIETGVGSNITKGLESINLTEDLTNAISSSFTPLTDQAAPSIMDSYLKGVAGQKSKSMQQSLLAAGGMSLYGYRPELESLRQVQFGNNINPYG